MNRRSFLQGMIAATLAAAGTALVRLAEPGEVTALAVGQPAAIAAETRAMPPRYCGAEVYMRDPTGEMVCVGFLNSFEVSTPVDNYWTWDGQIRVVPDGMARMAASFTGWTR